MFVTFTVLEGKSDSPCGICKETKFHVNLQQLYVYLRNMNFIPMHESYFHLELHICYSRGVRSI
jgi:hypothetical protein